MNKKLQATLAAAGVAVAGLALLAIYFGALGWLFQPKPDYTQWPGQVRIELMPPTSPEYLERHYPGPNGKDLKTEIEYRNGDKGVKLFRAKDNTLEDWTVEYAGGGTKLHAVFAKDGVQVVLGYEFRADHTIKWRAENKDNVVTTTTYYYDGVATFSIVDRKVGEDVQDARYFRKDGKPWLHQIAPRLNTTSPSLEEVWDKDGKLVYTRSSDKDGKTTTVTYYRADGTAAYKQTWGQYTYAYSGYPYGGFDDGGYYPTTTTVLKTVVEFAEDGKTVSREIRKTDDGSNIAAVIVYAADGSSKEYKADEVKVSDDLTKALPTAPKTTAYWEEQEKDPSKRGDEAP